MDVHFESSTDPPAESAGLFGRSSFIKRAVFLGGAVAVGQVGIYGLPQLSVSAPSATQDQAIFTFALMLEQLQSAFYSKVLEVGALKGEQLQFAELVGAQEEAHLVYLRGQLKGVETTRPTFHIGDHATQPSGFLVAAVGLEEAGLGAYNGQAPNLTPDGLRRAGRIISVEARHVAWVRGLAGELPAPTASDVPLTQGEALARIKKSGYVG